MTAPNTDQDALEKALRPFANEASELAVGIPDDCRLSYDGFPQIGLSDFTVGDLRRAKEALAAEKRRAREGVTDEMVELACRKYYNSGHKVYPPVFEAMRAALEAVWPDGQDAKDAARYRWLRSCGAAAEELAICTDYGWVTASDFDETVDAAMAQESGR